MERSILRIDEVSALLGVPEATLRFWRYKGSGPSSYKIGRRVVWDRDTVDAWIGAQRQAAEAPAP